MKHYDAIIIGTGQAGTPLARRLAGKDWKVAIIERQLVGGTCINYGCTPTKAMVASAKNAYQARRAMEYGVQVGDVSINMKALIDRKNKIVEHSRKGAEKSLDEVDNIDLIHGEASFLNEKTISVALVSGGQQELKADYIFIDTGTRTSIPEIDGLEQTPYLTSTTMLDLTEIPAHLLIIGASYIALEFGQMFRRYGSKVTILEQSERFLGKEDKDIADEMMAIFNEEDIHIHTSAKVEKLAAGDSKKIVVSVAINGKTQNIEASHLLLAAGRIPNTEALQLDKAGIKTDEKGFIKVNDRLETNVAGIYALGDVKGGPAFTHIAYNDYLVVCKNLLDKEDASIKGRPVPYCMFTDPELGRVGLSEDEATKKGINFKAVQIQMKHVARGIETGETKGFMKALVDPETKQILGVAILGSQGGEIMSLLQVAMLGKVTYEQLRENIFAHPTLSESINNLFMELDGE